LCAGRNLAGNGREAGSPSSRVDPVGSGTSGRIVALTWRGAVVHCLEIRPIMSTDERKPNPNATMQLDQIEGALDQVEFESSPKLPSSGAKPPPLPPVLPAVSSAAPAAVAVRAPSAAPPPAKKLGPGMVAGFVVLLVVAIGGGLYVGLHAPAVAAPVASTKPTPSAAPSVTAAATPSASASVQHFTLPTME